MSTRPDGARQLVEQAGYLDFSGAHLYSVLHEAPDPVARILLAGPFASERAFSYVPWVRWARFLAARRIEVLRFDYRGVGESTGVFEEMSFQDWAQDIEFLASWLGGRSPKVPLVLNGLGLGALLASKVFEHGVGDALLLWAPHASANEMLRVKLSHSIAVDQAFKIADKRLRWTDYVRQLEADGPLEIDGYRWSGRLWRESFEVRLPIGEDEGANAVWSGGRPLKLVKLNNSNAPLVNGSWLAYAALNPDLSGLFSASFEWVAQALTTRQSSHA